jgi:hypothetical protein
LPALTAVLRLNSPAVSLLTQTFFGSNDASQIIRAHARSLFRGAPGKFDVIVGDLVVPLVNFSESNCRIKA